MVALRPIAEGEEIFLDYGDAWEDAWLRHVQNWKPVDDAESFIPAFELNQIEEFLRTSEEQQSNPYPTSVDIHCLRQFLADNWDEDLDEEWDRIWEGLEEQDIPFPEGTVKSKNSLRICIKTRALLKYMNQKKMMVAKCGIRYSRSKNKKSTLGYPVML